VNLRDEVVSELELSQNANKSILSAVKDLKADRQKLVALCETLDAADEKEALVKLADLMTARKELEEIKPQFEDLKKEHEVRLAKEIEADVDRVIKQNGYPESMKRALTLARKDNADQFAADFPVLPEDSRNIIASNTVSADNEIVDQPLSKKIDLSSYAGNNIYFKAIEYCKDRVDGFNKKSWEQQMDHVREMRKKGAIKEE